MFPASTFIEVRPLDWSQWDPQITAVDGGVVVAWTDFRNLDELGRDLFTDFVSASGVRR